MTLFLICDSNELGRWDKEQVWRDRVGELAGLVIDWIEGETGLPWDFESGLQGVWAISRNTAVRKKTWWLQVRYAGLEGPVRLPPQNDPQERMGRRWRYWYSLHREVGRIFARGGDHKSRYMEWVEGQQPVFRGSIIGRNNDRGRKTKWTQFLESPGNF